MLGRLAKRGLPRFQPGLLPSLLVACFFPLLVNLGFWQLDRAEEKSMLFERWHAQQTQAPISTARLNQQPDPAYLRVELSGHFDAQNSYLLDNRTRQGVAGAELIQPFYDANTQRWFLVNRGWLAWPLRSTLPVFGTPSESVTLNAWVYVPSGDPFVLSEQQTSMGTTTIVSAIRPQSLWKQLDRTGYRYELRLESSPYAFDIQWPQTRFNPQTHQGYALQWFSLAAALVALFIYFGLYHARENNNEPSLGRT